MEDVLAVYERPDDPNRPVVCMDEQPVQLLAETRQPLPARAGVPQRYDYEYRRAGTACVFLFTDVLRGWRRTSPRPRRTAVDWAHEVRQLLDEDYPDADRVVLVCDNLNTHTVASFYKAFPAPIARRLAERVDIHYTPVHGSWLNIAEIELSVLTRQCLRGRTPDMTVLRRRVAAWAADRNQRQCGVHWRFTTDNARIKLRRLYPQIQMA
jgi:DDE superfamily endonuclease